MTAIHVRNVPESVIAALKERATQHGHSMQQEIREILADAAAQRVSGGPVAPLELTTVRTRVTSTWRREEIYDDGTGR